jgi:hypothetical protein
MGEFARMVGWVGARRRPATPDTRQTKVNSRQVLDAWEVPYFLKLVARLEESARLPIEVSGDQSTLAERVGRQNAIRELVIQLKKEKETAERVFAQDAERQRQT